jgi:XRE family transcriptional regulator, regulator of sulfur utilization
MTVSGPPQLGKSIQARRKERGLSLDVLAERSQVSKAMLSQIESDKVNPTVGLLWRIAEGLNLQLQDLLAMDRPQTHFEIKDRANSPLLKSDDGLCDLQILSPPNMIESVELYLVYFQPAGTLASRPHFPNTEEIVTCLKGKIEVISGDRSEKIEPWKSVHYSADVPHSLRNLSRGEAVAYLAVRYQRH